MPNADMALQLLGHKLWTYFIDQHLLGTPMLIMAGAFAVMLGEVLICDWQKTTLYRLFVRRSVSARTDLVFWVLQTTGLVAFIEIALTFGVSFGGERLAQMAQTNLHLPRLALPEGGPLELVFSFTVFWIVSGFFGYWVHRIYHGQVFWPVHRFHHAAGELNFITALRLHPVEALTRVLLPLSPLTFMHVPDGVLLTSVIAGNFINYCQHSELEGDWGWIGRWIFGGPQVHQYHHSIDDVHRDVNFGNCPLWDHVFGTWYGGPAKPSAYGTRDHLYNERPVWQFFRDGAECYRRLGAWLISPFRRRAQEAALRAAD